MKSIIDNNKTSYFEKFIGVKKVKKGLLFFKFTGILEEYLISDSGFRFNLKILS
jgi:hypothetical protein